VLWAELASRSCPNEAVASRVPPQWTDGPRALCPVSCVLCPVPCALEGADEERTLVVDLTHQDLRKAGLFKEGEVSATQRAGLLTRAGRKSDPAEPLPSHTRDATGNSHIAPENQGEGTGLSP
jgi:hypothetical protein